MAQDPREPGNATSDSSLVRILTDRACFFLFEYSCHHSALLSCSGNSEAMLGVKESLLTRDGNLFLRYVHPDDRFLVLNQIEHLINGQGSYRLTYRWIRPDTDQVRWLHCRAEAIRRNEDWILEGALIDITDELEVPFRRALSAPESLPSILASLPLIIFTLDVNLRISQINRPSASCNVDFGDNSFQRDSLLAGKRFLDCFGPSPNRDHLESSLRHLLEGRSSSYHSRFGSLDRSYTFEISPLNNEDNIEGLLCMVNDVSDRTRLENRVRELEKTEGITLLATGVAHHFNNSFQAIMGQASALLSHPDRADLTAEIARAIMEEVSKTSELSKQLFALGESKAADPAPIDVNSAVMTAANRVTDLLSSGVRVGVAFGNVPPVRARKGDLVEAIEALIRHGQAALNKEHGILSVKTYLCELQPFEVNDLAAGSYVKISVSDTPLRDADIHTVQPLPGFSDVGSCLAKSVSIVREFNGAVSVENRPQLGPAFSLYLPVFDPKMGKRTEEESLFANQRAGKPIVLLVDDDLMVLQTVKTMLNDLGYECVVADDYARAVHLGKLFQNSLEVVLLDAVMPGRDSVAILRRLRRISPQVPVIGFSGASHTETQPLLEAGAIRILQKPVDPVTLKEVIQQAREAKQAA